MRPIFALLLGAVVAPACWPQAVDRWGPAAYFARSDDYPPTERPSRDHRWPDRDDYSAFLDDADVERWVTQANAGRAQAAINAGDHWLIRSLKARGNCAQAIEWYRRAEELGSEFAAGRLGAAYSDDNCPQRDLATAIEWWRKAVDLGSYDAARVLSLRLSEGGRHRDPILALAYAEVAADNPTPWPEYQDPPPDPLALAATLAPAQAVEARRIAEASRAAIHARAAGFADVPRGETLLRRELAHGTVRLSAVDDLRECESNLVGNCRGVRRLAYAEVNNTSDEYLRCSFRIGTTDGNDNTPTTLELETFVAPQVARFLRLGRIAGSPDPGALRADCEPLPGFAAAVASGTCTPQPVEAFDLASLYPKRALAAGIEGRVGLYVVTNAREGPPLFVEVIQSAPPLLEAAALEAARNMRYRSDCDAGYRAFAIDFRLAE